MATLRQVVSDPRFYGLPRGEQEKVLLKVKPDFGRLPAAEREKVFGALESRFRVPGAEQTGVPPPPTTPAQTPEPMGMLDTVLGMGRAAVQDVKASATGPTPEATPLIHEAGLERQQMARQDLGLPPVGPLTQEQEAAHAGAIKERLAGQFVEPFFRGPAELISGIPRLTQSPEEAARKTLGMPPVMVETQAGPFATREELPLSLEQEQAVSGELERRQRIADISRQFGGVDAPPPMQPDVAEAMAKQALNEALSFLSPASLLTMGTAGAARPVAKHLLNSGPIKAVFKNSPAALKFLDMLADNAVSLGFVGLTAKGATNEFQAAKEAYASGDTEQGMAHASGFLTNLLLGAAAGKHAIGGAKATAARGPKGPTPEQYAAQGSKQGVPPEQRPLSKSELKREAQAQTEAGNILTAAQFEARMRKAPVRRTGGKGKPVEPVNVQVGKKVLTVQPTGQKAAGRDVFSVVDASGKPVKIGPAGQSTGTAGQVQEWIRLRETTFGKVPGPAKEFAEDITRSRVGRKSETELGEIVPEAVEQGVLRPRAAEFTPRGEMRVAAEAPAIARTAADIKRPRIEEAIGDVSAQMKAPPVDTRPTKQPFRPSELRPPPISAKERLTMLDDDALLALLRSESDPQKRTELKKEARARGIQQAPTPLKGGKPLTAAELGQRKPDTAVPKQRPAPPATPEESYERLFDELERREIKRAEAAKQPKRPSREERRAGLVPPESAEQLIRKTAEELGVNLDELSDQDYDALLRLVQEQGGRAAVGMPPVPAERPSRRQRLEREARAQTGMPPIADETRPAKAPQAVPVEAPKGMPPVAAEKPAQKPAQNIPKNIPAPIETPTRPIETRPVTPLDIEQPAVPGEVKTVHIPARPTGIEVLPPTEAVREAPKAAPVAKPKQATLKPVTAPAKEEAKPAASMAKPATIEQEESTVSAEELASAERTLKGEGPAQPEVAAVSRPRRPKGATASGEETSILVPGESTSYRGRYEVRELADIFPSHRGATFEASTDYQLKNDRNYEDPRNQERVVVASQGLTDSGAKQFNPRILVNDNPDAVNGPSVIDEDGNVLGGNSRAMILQRVRASNPAGTKAYRDLVQKKAAGFGIDAAQLEGMKFPVLVRVLPDSELSDPQAVITKLNKTGTAALTPAERAVSDSGRVSVPTLEAISRTLEDASPEATLGDLLKDRRGTDILNRLVDDGVISTQDKPAMIDQEGVLTPDAKERIRRLVVGQVFRDPGQMDRTPKAVQQRLERIAAPLATVRDIPGFELDKDVAEAIGVLEAERDAKARGFTSIDEAAKQTDIFGKQPEKFSPRARAIADVLAGSSAKARDAFRNYAANARLSRPGASQSLFGKAPTAKEAFDLAFRGKEPKREDTTYYSGIPAITRMAEIAAARTVKDWGIVSEEFKRFFVEEEGASKAGALVLDEVLGQMKDIALRFQGRQDHGWLFYGAHLPAYIAEAVPEFAPMYKRARLGWHEKNQLVAELTEILEPYFALKGKERALVNERLRERRRAGEHKINEEGMAESQVAAARAVSRAMYRALGMMGDLVAYTASDGKIATARGITSAAAFQKKLEDSGMSGPAAKKMAQQAWPLLEEIRKQRAAGYVPFSRFGQYKYGLHREGDQHDIVEFEKKETPRQARLGIERLKNDPRYRDKIANGEYAVFGPDREEPRIVKGELGEIGGYELHLLARIGKLRPEMHADLAEAIKEITIEKKKLGFKAHFVQAKMTPGEEEDLLRPIADYVQGITGHVSKTKMMHDLNKLFEKLPQNKPQLAKFAKGYIAYLQDPNEANASRWMRAAIFHSTLGFSNLPSAAVNLSQIPQAMAWMLQHNKAREIEREFRRAAADVTRTITVRGPNKGYNYEKLPDDVREAAKASLEDGTLAKQTALELGDVARGYSTGQRGLVRRAGRRLGRLSAAPFSGSEHTNRLTVFIAAHRLWEKAKHTEFDNPTDFAENIVDLTQNEYGPYNRAVWGRNNRAVLAMFKSYAAFAFEQYLRLSMRIRGKGGVGGKLSAAGRRRVRWAAAAFYGLLLTLAGFLGTPFATDLAKGLSPIYRGVTGDTLDLDRAVEQFAEKQIGTIPADVLLNGVSRATPFDFSRRFSLGEMTGLGEFVNRTAATGQMDISQLTAATSITGRAVRGVGDFAEEGPRAWESLAPSTVSGFLKAKRMAKHGLVTRSGGQIPLEGQTENELTGLEVFSQFLNITPTRVSRAYDQERDSALAARPSMRRSNLIQSMALEIQAINRGTGSEDLVEQAAERIAAFNQKNPGDEITPDDMERKLGEVMKPGHVRRLERMPVRKRGEYLERIQPQ